MENVRKPIVSCYQRIHVSKLSLCYLNMSFIDLATRLKIRMYLLIRKSVLNLMNCRPIKDILRYHKIDIYALHTPTTRKKQVFEHFRFKCYTTRHQWSPFKMQGTYCTILNVVVIYMYVKHGFDLRLYYTICFFVSMLFKYKGEFSFFLYDSLDF